MKRTFILMLLVVSNLVFSLEEKKKSDSKPVKGENIFSFTELAYGTTKWVEIYLYNTADSIIVTTLRSKTMNTEQYESVYVYSAAKKDLDLSAGQITKYLEAKEPADLMQIDIPAKGKKEVVTTNLFFNSPRGFNGFYAKTKQQSVKSRLVFIVKNTEEGKKILRKLK